MARDTRRPTAVCGVCGGSVSVLVIRPSTFDVLLSNLPMVDLHAVELDDVLPPHYVVYLLDLELLPFP